MISATTISPIECKRCRSSSPTIRHRRGNKATLFDDQGRLVASHLAPLSGALPSGRLGRADPIDWWRGVTTSTRVLLAEARKARVAPAGIAAVTFSGQMMGIVPVDTAGHRCAPPSSGPISAPSTRRQTIAAQCGAEHVYHRTGHRVSPAYLAAKILWVKRHQPDLYRQARSSCARKITSPSNSPAGSPPIIPMPPAATCSILPQRPWSMDLLDALGLDVTPLPDVHASTDVLGEVTRAASEATGLQPARPSSSAGATGRVPPPAPASSRRAMPIAISARRRGSAWPAPRRCSIRSSAPSPFIICIRACSRRWAPCKPRAGRAIGWLNSSAPQPTRKWRRSHPAAMARCSCRT